MAVIGSEQKGISSNLQCWIAPHKKWISYGKRPSALSGPLSKYTDIDDAIAWANDCEYGLTSSVYTQNLDYAFKIMRSLKFGETYINRENFEAMQGFHAGWRKSGIGGADGKHGLEEYLQTHVVYIETKE